MFNLVFLPVAKYTTPTQQQIAANLGKQRPTDWKRVIACADHLFQIDEKNETVSAATLPINRQRKSPLASGIHKAADLHALALDPITFEVMTDPVLAADGFTYDRKVILEHVLRRGHTSPCTGGPLVHNFLTPNKAVRDIVSQSFPHVLLKPWMLTEIAGFENHVQ